MAGGESSKRRRLWGVLRHGANRIRSCCLPLVGVASLLLCFLAVQQPRLILPTWRGYPGDHFRNHWLRIVFPFQDAAEARRKAALPRFRFPRGAAAFPHFPVHVISLKNATQRRAAVAEQLEDRGIAFQWFDAVDGGQELPEDEVLWHTSGAKRAGVLSTGPGSFWRRHIADDLSHFRLMHLMVAGGHDMQLVFEDDFHLIDQGGDFIDRLRHVMLALPNDWEIFWLNHGKPIQQDPSKLLGFVGQGVRTFAENSGMLSYIYRRSFALRALNDAQIGNKDIDDLLNDLGALGEVAAYVADPPLVRPNKQHNISQIEVPPSG